MAATIVLEPIFEVDLPEEQYGYRPRRNAIDATQKIHSLLNTGHTEVIDADLKSYFDEIPHFELLKSLSRRIADGQLLKLIKSWLEAPSEEPTAKGKKILSNQAKQMRRGTSQGSPLSPLLSNVYMRRFILAWKKLGYEQRYQSKIVSYADDFVICCKKGKGFPAMESMRAIMERIRLKVNEEKTRLCRFGDEKFDFLGYTFGYCYSPKSGKRFIGTKPSQKKISEACAKISEVTATNTTNLSIERTVERMNHILVGWFNYFKWGVSDPAFRVLDNHSRHRLRQWLRRKRVPRTKEEVERPITYYFDDLGVVNLETRPRNFIRVRA
jgi:RNA-directed DNA polymerase